MKLCADILYWRLKEELKAVELHGAGSMELTLSRPEFYLDRRSEEHTSELQSRE